MTQTADPTPRSFVDELKDGVTPRATLLVIGVLALQLLFIASYVGALHSPKLRDVPFGVVAPRAAAAEQAVTRLERLPGEPLDPRTVADRAAARERIMDREIDGALLIDPAGTTDTLLVTSGGGRTLANALVVLITTLEKSEGRTLRTVDVAPADIGDANGLTSFYLVVGWCVGGYLCASALAMSAGARPTNIRRGVIRLAALALFAIVGGLGGAVIAGPVLGALPGSVAALWGLGALVVFAVGAATLALQCVFGIMRHRGGRPAGGDRGQPERGRRAAATAAASVLGGDRPGTATGRGRVGGPLDRVLRGQRRHRPAVGALRLGSGGGRHHRGDGGPEEEAGAPTFGA